MKAKKKRGVDLPPKVKAFINSVTSIPLENIDVPLATFHWEYEKGDFYHWVDLMNHFDSYFERYIRPRKDLQLEGDFDVAVLDLPRGVILQILRVTRIILENCINKHCYSSYEHLSSLLASTDADIVAASLQTLAAFVKKPVQSNRAVRWHGDQVLNARLFSLSQGWGCKEEGLGLLACAIENGCEPDASRLGSTLHFEFYSDSSAEVEGDKSANKESGLKIIHKSDLHKRCETDLQLLKELVDQFNVPSSLRFSLLSRLRFARSFPCLHVRRQYLCIRLLAFTILLQSNPDHEDLSTFFGNEPEFVNELVMLLRCEDSVPEDIRLLAVLALAAQAQDRTRQSSVLTAISAGGHRGILPGLMQKAVNSVISAAPSCSVSFVEALLFLITVLVSSSSGCVALRESGLIPTLLPLLKDTNPLHTHLVSSGVHILETFMDYSNPAGTLFRDLGGLDDAIERLKFEIKRVEEGAEKQQEELLIEEKGKMPAVDYVDGQHTTAVQSETLIPFQQRLLLKVLLRAIALGTYAPGNAARIHGSEESALPACLCTIFKHAKEFGGGVFSLAASVMSDLIHKDPTCFSVLDSEGLPAAFLDAISTGVLPSSEAVSCIPNSLDALCLNNSGLQAVKDRNALSCFVKIFTSKSYLRALANETPGYIASGLDELMRHAPSLRGPGVDACIEILKTIAVIGGISDASSVSSYEENDMDAPVPMETDSDGQTQPQSDVVSSENSSGNVEAYLPECINNTARLLETLLKNVDTSRVFIEKKGIEAVLNLYTLPNLPVSFGGSSAAHSMSLIFRAFSPQLATTLARAVCGALREHLCSTLDAMKQLASTKISDLESVERTKLIRCLAATELFLSLSSVLVRNTNTMMTEFSAGGADVLHDIGKVHREVLWQISLIDDAKSESKREDTGSSAASVNPQGTSGREGEDESGDFPSVRYVNPVSLRDGTASPWVAEQEFLPIMSSGEGLHRRSRREHVVAADFFPQVGRLGRLAHHAEASQIDLEGSPNSGEASQSQDAMKRKSPDSINYEMMSRLVSSARGLYVALGKAMVVPSRRRDDVAPGSNAKAVAAAMAKLLHDNLSFDGGHGSQMAVIKCRFLGKVVDDILAIVFDNRRHTCNTLLVNNLYAHGAITTLLDSFAATSQLLWTVLRPSVVPMESEDCKVETEKMETGSEKNSWLWDVLRSYARLIEHLVTSALLLSPQPMAQLLVQQGAGGSVHIPKDPEALVRRIQSQVMEVVVPVWNHPLFAKSSPDFITSMAAIITHIYSGVGNVKGQRSAGARMLGPPPDESAISVIVEMGFSRERAEEALRRVVTNSVEMAMEWLFSHPEEPQEDDEFARALALSLGGTSDAPIDVEAGKGKEVASEEDILKTPPIDDMLATCIMLLRNTEIVAFPVTDLLVTMSNHNDGQDRAKIVSYLINQLKVAQSEDSDTDSSLLSIISHTLALILNEDSKAREIAAEYGLVAVAIDILSTFNPKAVSETLATVPKWVTALLLVLDHLLQYKPKAPEDTHEPVATTSNGATGGSDSLSDGHKLEAGENARDMDVDPFILVLGKPTGFMTEDEQHRAMTVACNLLGAHIPATTVQAILQLCARLTKTYSVAMQFLESGGLTAISSLPRHSLFPGFDNVAAIIIRHMLEDPQTLQQAMELEIRHTLMATLHRHNGRVSPRMFLTALAPVVLRNPTIFMQASAAVCQIENIGGRPHVVLSKEKEKEREREKEREKEKDKDDKDKDRDKSKGASGLPQNGASPGLTCSLCSQDVSSKGTKVHHKKVPHSFAQVIDQLLEVILHSPAPQKDGNDMDSVTAMEFEVSSCNGKGKAKLDDSTAFSEGDLSEMSAGLAKVAFILKLMTEILLMYSGAVGVVLRRDLESSQGRGPSQAGSELIGHGGLLYHILHRLLPYPSEKMTEKLNEDEWREKLSDKAAYFLMAVCVRSAEGRRRVVAEISRALSLAANNAQKDSEKKLQPPNRKVRFFVVLVNLILSAHSSSNAQAPGFSTETAKTMIESGLVQSLTSTLQVIDLDHPEAPKFVNAVLKALETLTRAATTGDQVYGTAGVQQKKAAGMEERSPGHGIDATGQPSDVSAEGGGLSTPTRDHLVSDPDLVEARMAEGSMPEVVEINSSIDNNMQPDSQIATDVSDGVHVDPEAEDFMHESSGNPPRRGETATAEITFRVEHRPENAQDEDDEEMDGDDGEEEDEEDDEDDDDMEGAEGVPHLSPPDTDVEDHEDHGLGDDYGEDMVEEDEDEDWQENRVIEVRWRDGLTRFNHAQVHVGQAGSAAFVDFPAEAFQGMHEIFSSLRHPTVVDRRRPAAGYRPFPERPGGEHGGAFHHPLLTRPTLSTLSTGAASTAGAGSSALWTAAGITRDTDALLASGGLDVTDFYMYDAVLAAHPGDRFFGERGVGGAPSSLLDFSMDPGYLTGRRGARSDGRLSSWTDDGQPQSGACAAAIAQGIEEQFISRLRSLLPEEEPVPDQVNHTPNVVEQSEQPRDTGDMEGVEPDMGLGMTQSPHGASVYGSAAEEQYSAEAQMTVITSSVVPPAEEHQGSAVDVQMQDERSATVLRDVEVGSQDSGATMGQSLRSLEVEIGSADGHDDTDRHDGSERFITSDVAPAIMEDSACRQVEASSSQGQSGNVEMSNLQGVGAVACAPSRNIVERQEPQEGDENRRQSEDTNRHQGSHEVNTIDPTFLEALPEYLRAEVLASHETQTVRAANAPPPLPPTEDIDPEFLAALPPDIQAEVLAQQRAQRLIQAQQVEGQPVDMDSASIIATFPAELREEVLLTSSEQVLAALPPSLLAEAQLLRERAMNQYQARGLFGGANRIGIRRSNIGIASGGTAAMDRGVGNIGGFSMVRRPGIHAHASLKMKEVEGKPLVDIDGLKAMLQLLRMAQPLGKGLLQRLLLNLCAHSVIRSNLVRLLLDMLRPEAEGFMTSPSLGDYEISQRLYGCRSNVVYARSQISDGIPPLVSRRVLEILTYLAKHHGAGADLLMYLEPAGTGFESCQISSEGNEKGKAKVVDGVAFKEGAESNSRGEIPLILLLKLLNQPLYSRSNAHLEQLMGLLEVVTNHLNTKCDMLNTSEAQEDVANAGTDARVIEGNPSNVDMPVSSMQEANVEQGQSGIERDLSDAEPSRLCTQSGGNGDHEITEPSTSGTGLKMDMAAILLSLPEPELRKLCRLLAQEGLSGVAYNRVAEVLKKLSNVAQVHRWLFISELADAARGLSCSAIAELCCLGDTETMVLSTGSMAGAAVLRVLQCLSTLTAEGNLVEKDDTLEQGESPTTVRNLNMALEPLWQGLSACIGKIEIRLGATGSSSGTTIASTASGGPGVAPPLPPGTQRVLPFVEAFFVLCEKLSSAQSVHPEPCTATAREIKEAASSSTLAVGASVSKAFSSVPKGDMTFLRFADKHRRMLNAFVRQNPALLEKSLSLLLKVPRLIDFDNKRAYFRSRIRQQHEQQHYAPLRICVRRAYVLEDSYNQLRMRTPDELKGRLTVQFQGEEGIDAGGLTREWYQLLSRVIFDKGALLFTTVGNESTFQPNPNSVFQTEHLSYFKFVGRVVAKALFDGQLLDVYFTRSFYKHILGVKVTYHDIEAVDPDYYKNLKWMLENDISDVVGVFFSVDADEEKHILYEKTEVTDVELIPGGRNVRVTEENKHEYVDLNAEHKLTTAIRPQINAFFEGFTELINRDLISIFNDKELELLISGLPEIDLDDLEANTEYTGYTAASPVVQWFWEVLHTFNKEDMARLLQFITGTSKVPLEGFKALQGISGPQRCQIHKAYGAPERLPTAHTCFNQLDLPEYSSKEQLEERLLLAIHEASEGFGFG